MQPLLVLWYGFRSCGIDFLTDLYNELIKL
jgi:hypothetical protein